VSAEKPLLPPTERPHADSGKPHQLCAKRCSLCCGAKQLHQQLPGVDCHDYIGSAVVAYTMTKYERRSNYASEKNTIFGRYSIAPYTINDPPALGAANGSPFDGGNPGAISEGFKTSALASLMYSRRALPAYAGIRPAASREYMSEAKPRF